MSTEFRGDAGLPLPIAQLYSRAFNDASARNRHDNAFYLFESLAKLTVAPLVALYAERVRDGEPRDPAVSKTLEALARPSLGHWVAMLRTLARHFGEQPDAPSSPVGHLWRQLQKKHREPSPLVSLYREIANGPDKEQVDARTCTLLQLFDALVQYRNGVFGHGGPRFESFYSERMGPLLLPAVNAILEEGVFDPIGPPSARLVFVSEVRVLAENRVRIGVRELVGFYSQRSEPIELTAEEASGIEPQSVGVLWPGRPTPLRLDPLLLFQEGETNDRLFFLNRDRHQGRAEYLCYWPGGTEDVRATASRLRSLLSSILGEAIDLQRMEAFATRSQAAASDVEPLVPESSPRSQRRVGDDYAILAEIGRGNMGVVYLARQQSLGRLVALKMLPAERTGDAEAVARLRREIRMLARCDHPSIIKLIDTGRLPEGQLYYTMEYIPGIDLEYLLRQLGDQAEAPLPSIGGDTLSRFVLEASRERRHHLEERLQNADPENAAALPPLPKSIEEIRSRNLGSGDITDGDYVRSAVTWIRDAAEALQTVHGLDMVHRDVKPANLMLSPDAGRIVLMDFGLAKSGSSGASLRTQAGFIGTLRYAAPEQFATASRTVGPPADVRALGVVLWELLTRRTPFQAEDEASLQKLIESQDLPRLRDVDAEFHPDLEAIVARATEREAGDRIQSAGDLARYLQMYLDGEPVPLRVPTIRELLGRWVREHRIQAASIAAALVVALFAGIAVTNSYIMMKRKDASIRRLSDIENYEELEARFRDLYPPYPNRVIEMENWIADAETLLGRLPQHQSTLARLTAGLDLLDTAPRTRFEKLLASAYASSVERVDTYDFGDDQQRSWWWSNLAELVDDLHKTRERIESMKERIRRADEVERLMEQHSGAWQTAIREAKANHGITLSEQIGLVPLGADPESGLQEFAHVLSGTIPSRRADGTLDLVEGSAVVLVLLPGVDYRVGTGEAETVVKLDPFFIAKHEFTQDQWIRAGRSNESVLHPGIERATELGITLRNPVDRASWRAATEVLFELGLQLPSETQWEYAARASKADEPREPWPTGNEPGSLKGYANVADMSLKELDLIEDLSNFETFDDGFATTAPVGSLRANRFGLHNMHGNVAEWCADAFFEDYDGGRARDGDGLLTEEAAQSDDDRVASEEDTEPSRVIRGGAWTFPAGLSQSGSRFPAKVDFE